MATSEDDARAMLDAEAASGRSIIMGFTRRYEHSWRTLVGLLRDGRIGTLQTVLLRSVIPYAPVSAEVASEPGTIRGSPQ
jgi:predicted dehydrogenase